MKHPLIHSVTIFLILMILTFSTVGVTPAYAATFTVTTTNNNGTGSLRQAITDAPSGSTITFDPSLSGMSIYLASTLTLTKNVTINGSSLASKITVSGDTNGDGFGDLRVFSVVNGVNATLDGLIITRGDLAGVGGAIFNAGILTVTNSYIHGNSGSDGGSIFNNSGSSLTVTNSIFSYNTATHFGGAIYNNGALVATNTTFSHNGGISGGAIYNNLGTLTLIKNTLSFNSALDGGGIFNSNSMLVTNSLFDSNIAQQSGGGIRNTGNLIMMNSTLSQNTAFGTGGGIDSEGTVSVSASTITGNSALAAGGIYNSGGLTLINSTLIGNSADLDGGAVFNNGVANVYNSSIIFNGADADADASGGSAGGVYNSDANGAVFNLRNTMVSGNYLRGTPIYNDCTGTINAYGRNLIGALSVVNEGACTVHLWSGSWEPLIDLNTLGVLQNNGGLTATVALLPGSNAIDQGDLALGCIGPDALLLPTDQRGHARVAGASCDIGAYEFNDYTSPTVLSIVRVNSNPTSAVNVAFTVNFSESVTGVDISDFSLLTLGGVSGYFISGISGSGSVYTVTVNTGNGNGTISLGVIDNDSVIDSLGNPLGGTGAGNGNFTGGEIYTITKPLAATNKWTGDFSYAQGWRTDLHPRTNGDVNGDGKDDLVGFGYGGIFVSLSNGTQFLPVSKWSGDYSYDQGWRIELHPRMVGDVNGDGKDDVVGYGSGGAWVALSDGTKFLTVTKWTSDFSYAQGWRTDLHPRAVGDMNGDGRDDLIGFGYGGIFVALSDGTKFLPVAKWSGDYSYDQGWRIELHPRMVGDMNGDGKDDVVGYGTGGVWVALSDGSKFLAVSSWTTDFSYAQGWRTDLHPRVVGDMNGDGRDDLVGFGYGGVFVSLSDGAKFLPVSKWSGDYSYDQGWRIGLHPRMVGDVNGDLQEDVVGYGTGGAWIALAQ